MDGSRHSGYRRVTVAASTMRIDLALPADPPVVELMTDLLDLAQLATAVDPSDAHGWRLSRIGCPALDPDRSLAAQQIHDGEVLYLDQRSTVPEPPVFDDAAEAIGVAATAAGRPWTDACGPAAGLVLAGGLVVLAGHAFWQVPAAADPGPLGLGAAAVLLAVFGLMQWAGGGRWTAMLVGGTALFAAALGGLRLESAQRPANWLTGSVALSATAVISLLALTLGAGRAAGSGDRHSATAVRAGIAMFAAGGGIGLAGVLIFSLIEQVSATTTSAAAGALVIGWIGLRISPRVALRLARITIPAGRRRSNEPDDTAADLDDLPHRTEALQQRAVIAVGYLAGLSGAATTIAGCAAVVLLSTSNRFGWLLAAVGVTLVLMQTRGVTRVAQMLAILCPTVTAGLCGLLILDRQLVGSGWPPDAFRPALWLLLAAAAISVGVVLPRLRVTPGVRRLRTIIEALLTAALVPLALASMDLYRTIRHL